jgi:hypothetical protein
MGIWDKSTSQIKAGKVWNKHMTPEERLVILQRFRPYESEMEKQIVYSKKAYRSLPYEWQSDYRMVGYLGYMGEQKGVWNSL